jgi:hypothetical protein
MPLQNRRIENRIAFADTALFEEGPKECFLQNVGFATKVGAIAQLSVLAEYANEIFSNTLEETKAITDRVGSAFERVERIEVLLERREKAAIASICHDNRDPLEDKLDTRLDITERLSEQPRFFQTNGSISNALQARYSVINRPPDVQLLAEYMNEAQLKRDGNMLKLYSDPTFFFHTWEAMEEKRLFELKMEKELRKADRKQRGSIEYTKGGTVRAAYGQRHHRERRLYADEKPAAKGGFMKAMKAAFGVRSKENNVNMQKYLEDNMLLTTSPSNAALTGDSKIDWKELDTTKITPFKMSMGNDVNGRLTARDSFTSDTAGRKSLSDLIDRAPNAHRQSHGDMNAQLNHIKPLQERQDLPVSSMMNNRMPSSNREKRPRIQSVVRRAANTRERDSDDDSDDDNGTGSLSDVKARLSEYTARAERPNVNPYPIPPPPPPIEKGISIKNAASSQPEALADEEAESLMDDVSTSDDSVGRDDDEFAEAKPGSATSTSTSTLSLQVQARRASDPFSPPTPPPPSKSRASYKLPAEDQNIITNSSDRQLGSQAGASGGHDGIGSSRRPGSTRIGGGFRPTSVLICGGGIQEGKRLLPDGSRSGMHTPLSSGSPSITSPTKKTRFTPPQSPGKALSLVPRHSVRRIDVQSIHAQSSLDGIGIAALSGKDMQISALGHGIAAMGSCAADSSSKLGGLPTGESSKQPGNLARRSVRLSSRTMQLPKKGFLADISSGNAKLRRASAEEVTKNAQVKGNDESGMGAFAGSAVMSILARRKSLVEGSDSSDDGSDGDEDDWADDM